MKNFVCLYLHFYTKKSLHFYTKKSLHFYTKKSLHNFHIHTHFNQTQAHAYKQIKAVRSKHIVEMYKRIVQDSLIYMNYCKQNAFSLHSFKSVHQVSLQAADNLSGQATCISWLLEAMIGIPSDRDTKLVNLPKQTQNEPMVGWTVCTLHTLYQGFVACFCFVHLYAYVTALT